MMDVERYRREGYCAPFRAIERDVMEACRYAVDRVLERPGPDSRSPLQSRHLDAPEVRELCEAPAIVERVRALLGSEVLLWRSHFFTKEPNAPALDWHRDADIWGTLLDPMRNVTAWLALERATRDNGCVEIRARDREEEGASVLLELEPGECFLFDHDVLHRSGPNPSPHRRLGLAIRFTLPSVRIDLSRLFPAYRVMPL